MKMALKILKLPCPGEDVEGLVEMWNSPHSPENLSEVSNTVNLCLNRYKTVYFHREIKIYTHI